MWGEMTDEKDARMRPRSLGTRNGCRSRRLLRVLFDARFLLRIKPAFFDREFDAANILFHIVAVQSGSLGISRANSKLAYY